MASEFNQYAYLTGSMLHEMNTPTHERLDKVISLLEGETITPPLPLPNSVTEKTEGDLIASSVFSVSPDRGMSVDDGRVLSKHAHILQSLLDIFTTPLGSRVMRRTYGSRIPELIDAPQNESTMLHIIHAAAEAALRWEPRISKMLIIIVEVVAGRTVLAIGAEDEDGHLIQFEVPLR